MTDQERKELAIQALKVMIKLLPPYDHGEDSDCEELQNCIIDLGGLQPEDYKDL